LIKIKKYLVKETTYLGDWALKLSSDKSKSSFVKLDHLLGFSCFSFGSFMYKRESSLTGLRLIVDDFKNNTLDINKIKGNFIILIWDGKKWIILKDRLKRRNERRFYIRKH